MAYDPFYSTSPSDSGLLDEAALAYPAGDSARRDSRSNVPGRDEYEAPTPGQVDADATIESLQDVPLPSGYLSRLRSFVNEL